VPPLTAGRISELSVTHTTNYNKSTEWYLTAHVSIVSGYAPQSQPGKLGLAPHILISV